MNKINDLYFDGEISKADRDSNIARHKERVDRLKKQIAALRLSADLRIKDKLTYSINLISNLGKFFQSATCEVKTKLLGSIFPEKLVFDGKKYRTKSFNGMLNLIYQETKHLQGKGKAESPNFSGNSAQVPQAGIEPARL